ncbi:hypothetical protein BDY19DRAFT_365442 [Irpex rosettiformis]|uniref:Uncharacterized protein n=1 Tax=Irpex rosettiformis TaxID=378272 RepID=A0ACB8TWK1_9APHY|nr:hypothetical protein BDY19DRAFT_365442 [Irpex rosettiformis]
MANTHPPILNVHTPSQSFSIVYSNTLDTLEGLFDKLGRKTSAEFHGEPVQPGWVKYSWNGSTWNLDDESDYQIFVWRQKSGDDVADTLPILHVHNPEQPLPQPPEYQNPSFYQFKPKPTPVSPPRSGHSGDHASIKSGKSKKTAKTEQHDAVPQHKKDFDKFHSENGVRTVSGDIGPVQNVRMLLKNGYRHVYISRKFALRHGFIPHDATPGHYGYSGLINLGTWPIKVGKTKTMHIVYLSEESHFDVVLGRSFWEARQIKTDPLDPTDVVCGDTGEKIDCELVILKDGKGQIITVT